MRKFAGLVAALVLAAAMIHFNPNTAAFARLADPTIAAPNPAGMAKQYLTTHTLRTNWWLFSLFNTRTRAGWTESLGLLGHVWVISRPARPAAVTTSPPTPESTPKPKTSPSPVSNPSAAPSTASPAPHSSTAPSSPPPAASKVAFQIKGTPVAGNGRLTVILPQPLPQGWRLDSVELANLTLPANDTMGFGYFGQDSAGNLTLPLPMSLACTRARFVLAFTNPQGKPVTESGPIFQIQLPGKSCPAH